MGLVPLQIIIKPVISPLELDLPSQLHQPSGQPDGPLSNGVVEVVPPHGPEHHHPSHSAFREEVVLAQLLALPDQWNPLGSHDGNQIGLHLIPEAPVTLFQEIVVVPGDGPEVADEPIVIMVLNVLQGALFDGIIIYLDLCRIADQIPACCPRWSASPILRGSGFGHSSGSIKGLVLPGAAAVGILQHLHRPLQLLCTLDERILSPSKNLCQWSMEPIFPLTS